MRLLIAALFSAGLITIAAPVQASPVNNSEKKAAHTISVEKPAPKAEEANVIVAKVEQPQTPQPESQPEAVSAPTPSPEPVAQPQTPTFSGTHEELMAAAGINPADYGAVDYIISHESSWNPDATEPTTGAHGLPQALPYSKTGCAWEDAVCQLKWATQYATERYGGWWGAYAQWVANRWW